MTSTYQVLWTEPPSGSGEPATVGIDYYIDREANEMNKEYQTYCSVEDLQVGTLYEIEKSERSVFEITSFEPLEAGTGVLRRHRERAYERCGVERGDGFDELTTDAPIPVPKRRGDYIRTGDPPLEAGVTRVDGTGVTFTVYDDGLRGAGWMKLDARSEFTVLPPVEAFEVGQVFDLVYDEDGVYGLRYDPEGTRRAREGFPTPFSVDDFVREGKAPNGAFVAEVLRTSDGFTHFEVQTDGPDPYGEQVAMFTLPAHYAVGLSGYVDVTLEDGEVAEMSPH